MNFLKFIILYKNTLRSYTGGDNGCGRGAVRKGAAGNGGKSGNEHCIRSKSYCLLTRSTNSFLYFKAVLSTYEGVFIQSSPPNSQT